MLKSKIIHITTYKAGNKFIKVIPRLFKLLRCGFHLKDSLII